MREEHKNTGDEIIRGLENFRDDLADEDSGLYEAFDKMTRNVKYGPPNPGRMIYADGRWMKTYEFMEKYLVFSR